MHNITEYLPYIYLVTGIFLGVGSLLWLMDRGATQIAEETMGGLKAHMDTKNRTLEEWRQKEQIKMMAEYLRQMEGK